MSTNKKKFGNSTSRLTTRVIDSPQQEAAELQHALANKIREFLLDQDTDLKRFTTPLPNATSDSLPDGLTYDRFQRILRGATMITTTDLMFWAGVVPGFSEFMAETMQALLSAEHVDGRYSHSPRS